ncbi:hypothetical protein AKJ57_02295 [candidate division MSBL1 archaeon SCGC-AAA259A05]|uniref:Tyr recombinase domain-containing protein n=1 Tax=candidate division MSBL1 archaeon SCGC-AAA259A05 TaxID=1698259 RepID=A0A133UAF4_9EURY|nr:hypothetical protein AKJ57_02295 [candidate division MSBL1 archaeon SCGC-AAA259A05]
MVPSEDIDFADKKIEDLTVEELRKILSRQREPEVEKEPFSAFAEKLKDTTAKTYRTSVRSFLKHANDRDEIRGDELDEASLGYLESADREKVHRDLSRFLKTLVDKGLAGQTVHTYASCTKEWLLEYGLVTEETWGRLKRKVITVSNAPEVRGEVLSRDQVKRVINKLDQLGRSLALFLLSAGPRINEALSIKKENLFLSEEPPRAWIEREHTKGDAPGRDVFFSPEARDEIRDWLNIAPNRKKRGYEKREDGIYQFGEKTEWEHVPTFDELGRVWEIDYHTARRKWNRALEKCGLDKKKDGYMIYNIHSLRSFFRSNWTGSQDVRKVLMGQLTGLDKSYLRKPREELAEEYQKNVDNYILFRGTAEGVYAKSEMGALRGSLLSQGVDPDVIREAFQDWATSTKVARRLSGEEEVLAAEEISFDTIDWAEVTEKELKDLRERFLDLAAESRD